MGKGSRFVIELVLFLILTTSVFALSFDSSPTPDNIARIFDFDNDGANEMLGFPDRIDSRTSQAQHTQLRYYERNNDIRSQYLHTKTLLSNITRCQLSYNDYNLDGYVDIVYGCFNVSDDSLRFGLLKYNGTTYLNSSTFTPTTSQHLNTTSTSYGDIIFFDFNNDGYPDILSCFLKEQSDLALFLYNQTSGSFETTQSGIPHTKIHSGNVSACYLAPLDFDNDGDLDVITYTYDANNFSLFNNTFCSLDSCTGDNFSEVTDNTYFNSSFFSSRKIKHLKAYDDGDGFSDLYYVVDDNNGSGSPRNISFGYFNNNHRSYSHSSTINPPNITNVTFHFNDPTVANFSWVNYTGGENYFIINMTAGNFSVAGARNDTNVFYNLNIENVSDGTVLNGAIPVNNYDYNTGYGNLLNRYNLNFSFPNQCMNITAQTVAPSLMQSAWSDVYTYNANISINGTYQLIEFCDGLDNDCDGDVDNNFTFIWPDGVSQILTFDNDSDGHVPQYPTFRHSNGSSNWSVVFNCLDKSRNEFPSELVDTRQYFDVDDNNNRFLCESGFTSIYDSSQPCRVGASGTVTPSNGGLSGISSETNGDNLSVVTITPTEGNPEENTDTPTITPPSEESPSQDSHITSLIQELSSNTYRHERTITSIGSRTKITEKITNVDFFPLENVNVTLSIPKDIISHTREIIPITPFEILEEDPIIRFNLDTIPAHSSKEYSYTIKKNIKDFNISTLIQYKNVSKATKEERSKNITKQIEKTAEIVNLTKSYIQKDNETIYNINVDFKDNETILYDVSIFEEIPKCLLEIINEETAESDRDFEIINEDPLIVWHFDKLLKGDEIQLKIRSIADEDCMNLGATIALARDIIAVKKGKEGNLVLWPPLAIMLALLLIFLFIAHYTKEKYLIDPDVQLIAKKAKRMLRKHHNLEYIHQYLRSHHKNPEHVKLAIDAIRHPIRQFFIKLAIGLDSTILLLLLVLNILDFVKIPLGDVDFIKKLISWILLALVFHHVGISKVLFGREKRWIDATLIISFFLLTIKNFVGFARATFTETRLVEDFYIYIINNHVAIETATFLIGFIGIIVVTIYMTSKKHIHKDSLMGALFLHGKSHQNRVQRFFQVLFVTLLFFILVFNLMFEWLAIAVDAPILVTVLIITVILVIVKKLHSHYRTTPLHLLETITETPDHFYEKLIELFHHPKFLPLGIAGMFVLHVVTEIGIYVIPYAFGVADAVYVNILESHHAPLFAFSKSVPNLFSISAKTLEPLVQAQFAAGYALNILALFIALVVPVWLWSYMMKHKSKPLFDYSIFHAFTHHDSKITENIAKVLLLAFPASILIAITKPAFVFKAIQGGMLAGIDIMTHVISINGLYFLLLAILLLTPLVFILEKKYLIKLAYILMLVSFVAVILYDLLYIESMSMYVISLAKLLVDWSSIWILLRNLTIILTLALTAISLSAIYIVAAGLLLFMYLPTKWKHLAHKLLPKHIAEAQKHNHIHFHHLHDHHMHGSEVNTLKRHIEKQIESGHDLFIIVEHLHAHGWPWDVIEQAVYELDRTKKFSSELAKIKHYHHKKPYLKKLTIWIKKHYKEGKNIESIIEVAKKCGWSEDDIGIAMTSIKFKDKDRHIKDYLENIK
jgi:hypothetical protein